LKKDFPGTLFLIVGNSGSGKDSIIKGVIEKYPSDLKSVYLTKRYITRPPSDTEDNISLSLQEFREMANQGKFALMWNIYGLNYGIPVEIENWLKKGHPVIINVSRTIVNKARKKYKNIKIVFVKVPFEVTLKRLTERDREKGKLLEERIKRAKNLQNFSKADYVVDNAGKLEDAINQFLDYLIKIIDT
jgi:phosphonate metabolism protein PhnN/1,5-bisphosphokinase (PRPP-forming)